MQIAAHIIGCHQVSETDYQRHIVSYVFDSSQTIDEIIAATGKKDISALNLSTVKEISVGVKNTEKQVQADNSCEHSFSPVYMCVHCGKLGDSIA